MKISTWDESTTKREVQKRYRNAVLARAPHEERWRRNERNVYAANPGQSLNTGMESPFQEGLGTGDAPEMNVAYTFKNLRFIHAQMSSNPPSVVMRPASSDQEDKRKADAADRVARYALRHYSLQEKTDQMTLHTLLYGTGVIKTTWDASRGAIVEVDRQTDEITLEGDIAITTPFLWNIRLDPDAKAIDEIKFVVETVFVDYEEACLRWPDRKEALKKARIERSSGPLQGNAGNDSELENEHYNCVELLEYWETGLPTNGYLGRYCITTTQFDVVEPCRPSPFRFRQAGGVTKIEAMDISDEEKELKIDSLPEQARLPYHFLTDIDVPNTVWGRSFVGYTAALQENLNNFDSARLDNLKAHGVARLVVSDSAEISDDGLSDSPWDVTRIVGTQGPWFMQPPQLMGDMTPMRQDLVNGINDISGVNESMFGQQSREQAAAAMQFATNQGNTIRRRLFNKYVLVVESIYRGILDLVRRHWTVERKIHVVGKEKALEAVDISGTDIDGGYDVVGEYGVSLSLDPITRRQEVLTMQPTFERAGVPARTVLRMMKLSELEGLYDKLDLAGNRQKEIFDEMIATQSFIPPKKYRDHENMIAWALDYFMTSEFEMLPESDQQLCERHIEERGALAAQEKPGTTPGQAAAPAPAPASAPLPGPVAA